MNFRDILVHIDETPASRSRAQTAVDLARRSGAHVTGAFLTSEIPRELLVDDSYAVFTPTLLEQLVSEHRKALEDRADQARVRFEAIAAEAGVESEWRVMRGENLEALVACARRSDLTILPRTARPCLGLAELSAAELALACGGPVIVTPQESAARPLGKRILVAWNGGREAARALRDAWPLIAQAEELHVLVVSPKGEGGPDGLLQRHLERHGFKANLIVDPSRDEAAADVIERQAAQLDADLVVMGLYGRPRLQEFILGGVSRHMLTHVPVPLFVSH